MGTGSSKPAETLVFQRGDDPSIPIHIAPNLIRRLQGLPADPRLSRKPTTTKSGPTSEQVEAIVESRVQRELDRQTQRRVVFETRSADQVRQEAEELLNRLHIPPRPNPNAELVRKEEAVVSCYRNNPSRTLDCWREVEDLKQAVLSAQRGFVNALAA
ncbi:hypothetical protein DFJ73DRAFT_332982 [Zopfochytrium polystomum]|nr:hypothetical protein DFJ73DRAFT_332982 [Zopfochytrium polystomum]